ncbi:pentapeptide repeat-containing protein [Streptomyces sp. SID14478]|uniref:pentapeptide repeat-containing protein n=1 Tax=Streptomyces sp. SID14478 TaxID=2706073 RepID=UPI0013DA92D6|nr:pentapeptide repeat-containing protein [Streptomyces sp. SID14478]NEB76515.1 pentapeptide repeat-containing protein [Streptomyces sp. SID14478]
MSDDPGTGGPAPEQHRDPWRKRHPRWAWTVAMAGTAAFIVLLIWGPWWIEGHHLKEDGKLVSSAGIIVTGFRTMLIAVAAGGLTAASLYYTREKHRLEREQFQHAQDQFAENQKQFETTLRETQQREAEQSALAREGQVTGRYVEAIKLLGSTDSITQRLGAIYSLERIMLDSDRDRRAIADVLAAFIRSQAPRSEGAMGREKLDVKAALVVLGRNSVAGVAMGNPKRLDLSQTDLRGYHLHRVEFGPVNFDLTDFDGADLSHATFVGVSLRACMFRETVMRSTGLAGTELDRADFTGADLTGADLSGTQLSRAIFTDAVTEDTKLHSAKLRTSRGWQRVQVDSSRYDAATEFPPDIADWLQARDEEATRTLKEPGTTPEETGPPAH